MKSCDSWWKVREIITISAFQKFRKNSSKHGNEKYLVGNCPGPPTKWKARADWSVLSKHCCDWLSSQPSRPTFGATPGSSQSSVAFWPTLSRFQPFIFPLFLARFSEDFPGFFVLPVASDSTFVIHSSSVPKRAGQEYQKDSQKLN